MTKTGDVRDIPKRFILGTGVTVELTGHDTKIGVYAGSR